jgi:hypothetical protein
MEVVLAWAQGKSFSEIWYVHTYFSLSVED